jgi:hypothetical protein
MFSEASNGDIGAFVRFLDFDEDTLEQVSDAAEAYGVEEPVLVVISHHFAEEGVRIAVHFDLDFPVVGFRWGRGFLVLGGVVFLGLLGAGPELVQSGLFLDIKASELDLVAGVGVLEFAAFDDLEELPLVLGETVKPASGDPLSCPSKHSPKEGHRRTFEGAFRWCSWPSAVLGADGCSSSGSSMYP